MVLLGGDDGTNRGVKNRDLMRRGCVKCVLACL